MNHMNRTFRLVVCLLTAGAVLPALGQRTATSVLNIKGLSIEKKQDVQLQPYVMTDGGSFRWDIYGGLYVNSGTNNAYSGGMSVQIQANGNSWSFPSSGRAAINTEGDELQAGPFNIGNNLLMTRRVKVYKDAPLARWLTIMENPSDQEMALQLQVYVNMCWNIDSMQFSSGQPTAAADDWAVATQANGGNQNVPTTLHLFADARSKLKPTLQINGNSLYMRYDVRIPPKSGLIICNFESQGKGIDENVKLMKEFKAGKYLKDLPSPVRKLIANFSAGGGLGNVDLIRSDSSDCIIRNNQQEDPLYGQIANASFKMTTLFGELDLKADEVVGMTCLGDNVRVVTTNGQIISGQIQDPTLLLKLPTGGEPLKVPLTKVKQFSFQITKAKPDAPDAKGPVMVLRSGDQLSFDAASLAVHFRTRHGLTDLKGSDLLEIAMDNPGNALHRATFTNGSVLGGMIDDAKLAVTLTKPVKKLEIPREMILQIRYNNDEKKDPYTGNVQLNNGDNLLGRFTDDKLTIVTDVGNVVVRPYNLKSLEFLANQPGRVVATLWDKSVHRGRLQQEELTFQMMPGPSLKLSAGQLVKLEQPLSMPPEDVVKKVEAAVAKLYSESYKDRDSACEELMRMGPQIVPCLLKYLKDSDAEVRQRVGTVIEKLGGNKNPGAAPGGGPGDNPFGPMGPVMLECGMDPGLFAAAADATLM